MDSTDDVWRFKPNGAGARSIYNSTMLDSVQNFRPAAAAAADDDPLNDRAELKVERGLAIGYEATTGAGATFSISQTIDALELRRDQMQSDQIRASNLSNGANASAVGTGRGHNVDMSVLASFHEYFSEEKWGIKSLHGFFSDSSAEIPNFGAVDHDQQSSGNPNQNILQAVAPGTGSTADTCSEIPKLGEIDHESTSIEYFPIFRGQGNAAQLHLLGQEATFEEDNVTSFALSRGISDQTLLPWNNNLQPGKSFSLINNVAAEYTQDHTTHFGRTSDLLCSEDMTFATSRNLVHCGQWPPEDALMIFNHHAYQWQDELILFNNYHHQSCAQEDPADLREVHDLLVPDPQEQQQLPLKSTRSDEVVRESCVQTVSDIDLTRESFSFWPEETSFHSCPLSPTLWSGSQPVRWSQPNEGVNSYETNTDQIWENFDSSPLTDAAAAAAAVAALECILKPDTTVDAAAAVKHEVEAEVEACDSTEKWIESREDPVHSISQRDNDEVHARGHPIAGSKKVHVDKSPPSTIIICQGVSEEQETTTEMQQTVIADSLEKRPLEQDKNKFGDSAVAWLQEHASDLLLLHNTKRDRTNSIEMLSKPTSALRKKKQKDEEIPEGRLRGTSICTDPNLYYGLAAVQNLLKDFHGSAGFTLRWNILDDKRPEVTVLLDEELEAFCIEDQLSPEIKAAILAALNKRGRGDQQEEEEEEEGAAAAAAADSNLVEQILDLKQRLVSLLEESRSHERSTISQLKDTISRYAFLFPASATDALTKRFLHGNQYSELENLVFHYFRESKMLTGLSPSSGSSSSGRLAIEDSSDEASVPSYPYPRSIQGRRATEALGEGTAGPPPPPSVVGVDRRSERTHRIPSRRELSGARGNLPKVAAEFMRQWLFDNFHNPNPSREVKLFIAAKFNITEKQVTNHFVNLRARKFRPLLRSLHEDPRPEKVAKEKNLQGEEIDSRKIPPPPPPPPPPSARSKNL